MKVFVADQIDEIGVEILRKEGFEVDAEEPSQEELLKRIGEYHALIVRSRTKVTREVIERGERLKVIGRAGVGVDNIDVKGSGRRSALRGRSFRGRRWVLWVPEGLERRWQKGPKPSE